MSMQFFAPISAGNILLRLFRKPRLSQTGVFIGFHCTTGIFYIIFKTALSYMCARYHSLHVPLHTLVFHDFPILCQTRTKYVFVT